MNTMEIIRKYTSGEASLEETNAALKAAGAMFHLDPDKNVLTAEEIERGTAGLLDTGTGSFDKVEVIGDKLKYPVNEVREDGTVTMDAFVLLRGRVYIAYGDQLVALE